MIERIRNAVQKWLGIDTLEGETKQLFKVHGSLDKRIRKLDTEKVADIDKRLGQLRHEWASLSTQSQSALERAVVLTATAKHILEHFELAVDVGIQDPSWAVLIVHDPKRPQATFIDLRGADMEHIHMVLEQFNGIRQTVDTPFGVSDLGPVKKV
jgi:hypothetical protein